MYRSIDCDTWDDPWFSDLEPKAKLLFLYLITNRRSTPCGAFEITRKAIVFETGLTFAEVDELLTTLAPRVVLWPAHNVLWLRNFYKHQRCNDNYRKGATNSALEMPEEVQSAIFAAYPELQPETVPTPPRPSNNGSQPLPNGSKPFTNGSQTVSKRFQTGGKEEEYSIEENSIEENSIVPKRPITIAQQKSVNVSAIKKTTQNGTRNAKQAEAVTVASTLTEKKEEPEPESRQEAETPQEQNRAVDPYLLALLRQAQVLTNADTSPPPPDPGPPLVTMSAAATRVFDLALAASQQAEPQSIGGPV